MNQESSRALSIKSDSDLLFAHLHALMCNINPSNMGGESKMPLFPQRAPLCSPSDHSR